MDWKRLIDELMAAGVTQAEIGEQCKVSQPAVSDLRRGATKSPSFEFGLKLVELHRQRTQQAEPGPVKPQETANAT